MLHVLLRKASEKTGRWIEAEKVEVFDDRIECREVGQEAFEPTTVAIRPVLLDTVYTLDGEDYDFLEIYPKKYE